MSTAPQTNWKARQAWFGEKITEWCKDRNLDQAMTRKDLAALRGFPAMLAQRHSLMDNLGHLYAANWRLDASPGVLMLITFLSDNPNGCCTLSIGRMADFFSRTERRISEAIARLERDKVIFVDPPGRMLADGTWSRKEEADVTCHLPIGP